MIKKIATLHLVLALVVSIAGYFMNENAALTCALFSGLLSLNLILLYLLWRVIIFKKSIALGLLIIIFKYPIIAYILWQLSKLNWVLPIGILIALMLFVMAIAGVVLWNHFFGQIKTKE